MNDLDAAVFLQLAISKLDMHDPGAEIAKDAFTEAVNSLLKQVPVKCDLDESFFICPRCHTSVLPTKHCPNCGQLLRKY